MGLVGVYEALNLVQHFILLLKESKGYLSTFLEYKQTTKRSEQKIKIEKRVVDNQVG